MATYIPILGNFDEPFSIVDGAAAAVLRDATAALQGDPRPGKLRTVLQLTVPDGTAGDDDTYALQVPSPYPFTAAQLTTELNSFWPIVSALPLDPNGSLSFPIASIQIPGAWSEANQTIGIALVLRVPQAAVANFLLTVDFSHTLIS